MIIYFRSRTAIEILLFMFAYSTTKDRCRVDIPTYLTTILELRFEPRLNRSDRYQTIKEKSSICLNHLFLLYAYLNNELAFDSLAKQRAVFENFIEVVHIA